MNMKRKSGKGQKNTKSISLESKGVLVTRNTESPKNFSTQDRYFESEY